jgi:hypothetical protein
VTIERWAAVGSACVALAALQVYATTLLPSVGLWDTAEFQTVAPVLGVAHPTGYPAYVVLGFAWSSLLRPLVEPATAMNLFAAVCAAAAAGVTVDVVRRLTGRLALAVAVGIGLAATPICWAISTQADPHALHLALVAAISASLLAWAERVRAGDEAAADRRLAAVAVLAALAVANHSLSLLLLPGFALFIVATQPAILTRGRPVLARLGLFVGLVKRLYLELPLRGGPFRAPLVYGHPETLDGFLYIVTGEQFRGLVAAPGDAIPAAIEATSAMLGAQFGPLAPLVPASAVVTAIVRPRWALLSVTGAVVTCLFAASYVNADIGRYYLGPAFFAWTWLAIAVAALVDLVAAGLGRHRRGRRTRLATAASAVAALLLLVPTAFAFGSTRMAVDASEDRAAVAWLAAALDPTTGFRAHAVVVSWWDFSTPLWYAQHVDGRRPDLTIVDDRTLLDQHLGTFTDVIDANLGRRPVYAIRIDQRDLATIAERYDYRDLHLPLLQPVYEILGRRGAA